MMTFKHCEDRDHHVNQINIIKSYLPKTYFRFSCRGAGTFMSTPNLKKSILPSWHLPSQTLRFQIQTDPFLKFSQLLGFQLRYTNFNREYMWILHVHPCNSGNTSATLQKTRHDTGRTFFPRVGCSLRVGLKKTRNVP